MGDVSLLDADAILTGEFVDYGESSVDRGYVGGSVAPAGDTDGDGYADVLIGGAFYDDDRGVAYLVRGPVAGDMDLSSADFRVVGADGGDFLGASVASADVTGDGVSDALIGAANSATASLLVFAGPAIGNPLPSDADATFWDSSGNQAGAFVEPAGDANGDGYEDLWLNAAGDDRVAWDAGGAYLLLGPLAGSLDETDVAATLLGTASTESAGASLAVPGDVDGDGVGDLVVGTSEGGGWSAGSAYLVLGPFAGTRSLLHAAVKFEGDGDDNAGRVASAGDVDGDGLGDIWVSGPGDDDGGDDAGATWLVLASSVEPLL